MPYRCFRIWTAFAAPVLVSFALGVGACTPRVHNQGHEVDPERLAQVETGKTNRDQVLELLGSPTNNSAFGPEVWYYVSQRVHATLFFRPEVNDRKVVAIEFDDAGVVSAVNTLGLADGRGIQPVERATPTAGHEMTVFEQVFGNFGRFARKPQKPQPGGPNIPQ